MREVVKDTKTLIYICVCVHCREIEYLKKETAQRRAVEESEATHKEEADNLQEKVRKIPGFKMQKCLVFPF